MIAPRTLLDDVPNSLAAASLWPATRLKASPIGRDCLKVAESYLVEREWVEPDVLSSWRGEAMGHVDEVVAKVQREPGPDPYSEDWCALASKHLAEGKGDGT